MGVGLSVSRYVREIKAIVEASGLSATMHANGTSIEGGLVDICRLAERCEDALAAMGVQRTFFTLIFSTRRDKEQTLADKMAAVSLSAVIREGGCVYAAATALVEPESMLG